MATLIGQSQAVVLDTVHEEVPNKSNCISSQLNQWRTNGVHQVITVNKMKDLSEGLLHCWTYFKF